jgi:5-methylcytosine-specific restriction endonuclease McrA
MSKGRADHTWAKAQYQKAKKIIFASQSVCGICGRPVDFDKKFPDPWSATIDHIIPVIKGGDPTSLENLQLAHSYCNRQKSTKLVEIRVKEKAVSNRELPLSRDWSTLGS